MMNNGIYEIIARNLKRCESLEKYELVKAKDCNTKDIFDEYVTEIEQLHTLCIQNKKNRTDKKVREIKRKYTKICTMIGAPITSAHIEEITNLAYKTVEKATVKYNNTVLPMREELAKEKAKYLALATKEEALTETEKKKKVTILKKIDRLEENIKNVKKEYDCGKYDRTSEKTYRREIEILIATNNNTDYNAWNEHTKSLREYVEAHELTYSIEGIHKYLTECNPENDLEYKTIDALSTRILSALEKDIKHSDEIIILEYLNKYDTKSCRLLIKNSSDKKAVELIEKVTEK